MVLLNRNDTEEIPILRHILDWDAQAEPAAFAKRPPQQSAAAAFGASQILASIAHEDIPSFEPLLEVTRTFGKWKTDRACLRACEDLFFTVASAVHDPDLLIPRPIDAAPDWRERLTWVLVHEDEKN